MISSMGSGERSNAEKSKVAAGATKEALDASKQSSDGDFASHDHAAMAHMNASYANRDAGNGTKADQHLAQAKVHGEKAEAGRRAKSFADQETNAANALTHKAGMAQFGQDADDPRTEQQLHQDAAQAHFRASQSHQLAGNVRAAQFHAAKAGEHQALADGPPRGNPGSSSSGSSSSSASRG